MHKVYEFRRRIGRLARFASIRDDYSKNQALKKKWNAEARLKAQNRIEALKSPYLEIPPEVIITKDYVTNTAVKRKYNEQYSDYFAQMGEEYDDDTYRNIAQAVKICYTSWFFDDYRLQRVRDLKAISLCHNKFCSNCQHLLQASRLKRFTPILDDLQKDYDLYHLVLTVPNVDGENLRNTITTILRGFSKLMRYFSGDAKIGNMDFAQYGFEGAVRCLECTIKSDSFHPHIHALLVLRKGIDLPKLYKNQYSYDRGYYVRSFSSLEILVQKIWYLIVRGARVTGEAVKALDTGYSCTCDRIEGREYVEAFKYVTKLTKDDNKTATMTYEQFKYMYFALYRRRVLQGYGNLYAIAAEDDISAEVCKEYNQIIGKLQLVENPSFTSSRLDELIVGLYKNEYTCISKLSIQRYLNELAADDEEK